MKKIILISLFAAFIFGIIDVCNVFFLDYFLHPFLLKNGFKEGESHIVSGSIAASLSIMFSIIIESSFENKYNYLKSPFYDVIGIITGTILFLLIMRYYENVHDVVPDIKKKLII